VAGHETLVEQLPLAEVFGHRSSSTFSIFTNARVLTRATGDS
jgi:hypothetical protein